MVYWNFHHQISSNFAEHIFAVVQYQYFVSLAKPIFAIYCQIVNIDSTKIPALKVVLIQIQEFRSCKVNRKPTEKHNFFHCWPYTHICLRSHSIDLEQVITIIIALKRSPFSFWQLIQTGKVGYLVRFYSS